MGKSKLKNQNKNFLSFWHLGDTSDCSFPSNATKEVLLHQLNMAGQIQEIRKIKPFIT